MSSADTGIAVVEEASGGDLGADFVHQMLGKVDDAAKAAAWAEVGEKLAAFESNGKFKGPSVMIAAVGQRQ